jgi:hypothetical protein
LLQFAGIAPIGSRVSSDEEEGAEEGDEDEVDAAGPVTVTQLFGSGTKETTVRNNADGVGAAGSVAQLSETTVATATDGGAAVGATGSVTQLSERTVTTVTYGGAGVGAAGPGALFFGAGMYETFSTTVTDGGDGDGMDDAAGPVTYCFGLGMNGTTTTEAKLTVGTDGWVADGGRVLHVASPASDVPRADGEEGGWCEEKGDKGCDEGGKGREEGGKGREEGGKGREEGGKGREEGGKGGGAYCDRESSASPQSVDTVSSWSHHVHLAQ